MLGYIVVGMSAEPERVGRSGAYFTNVTFQLDGRRMFREEMRVAMDGRRLYFASSKEFSQKLFGRDLLWFEFTPADGQPTTTTFNVSGFEEAMKPVRKSCGW